VELWREKYPPKLGKKSQIVVALLETPALLLRSPSRRHPHLKWMHAIPRRLGPRAPLGPYTEEVPGFLRPCSFEQEGHQMSKVHLLPFCRCDISLPDSSTIVGREESPKVTEIVFPFPGKLRPGSLKSEVNLI
jgi:hypothetical protein